MAYPEYIKQRIVYFWRLGESCEAIVRHLQVEGHKVSKAGVHNFWMRFEETGSLQRKPGSGKKAKLCAKAEEIVEEQMSADDETTGEELSRVLRENGVHVCAKTALEWRKKLGWTTKSTR